MTKMMLAVFFKFCFSALKLIWTDLDWHLWRAHLIILSDRYVPSVLIVQLQNHCTHSHNGPVWVTVRAEFPFCSLLSSLVFKHTCYRWENRKVKAAFLHVQDLQLFALTTWTQQCLELSWHRKECNRCPVGGYKASSVDGSVHLRTSSLFQVQHLQYLTWWKNISSSFTKDISRRCRLISDLTCQDTEKSHWHSRCI